jgi:uncharacterized protein YktB (UPF0637 family)
VDDFVRKAVLPTFELGEIKQKIELDLPEVLKRKQTI